MPLGSFPPSSKWKDNYTCVDNLGQGSFGLVHKVVRKHDGMTCVCKKVAMDQFQDQKKYDQALAEATIMSGLDCPYIVEYMEAFTENDFLYVIMQYCDKGDLLQYLKTVQVLPHRTIWRIFIRIIAGLAYLHDKRILHRDIKSANIFLAGTNEGVRIGDLGQARKMSHNLVASTLVGTPKYLSPEEVSGLGRYTDKCDIWALGNVLYELCSHKHRTPFFKAKNFPDLVRAVSTEEPPELPDHVGELREVCRTLLDKDPEKRPSASDLLSSDIIAENADKHRAFEESSSLVVDLSVDGNVAPVPATPAESDGATVAGRCNRCVIL